MRSRLDFIVSCTILLAPLPWRVLCARKEKPNRS